MIKLFAINHDNNIHHLIEVGEEFIISDDEFIRLEFDFDWITHTRNCLDCLAFKNSLVDIKSAYKWHLQSDDGIFLLDSSEFAKNDHFKNSFENSTSNNFTGVKLKIKKIGLSYLILDEIRLKEENHERYEQCNELRNAISLLNGNS